MQSMNEQLQLDYIFCVDKLLNRPTQWKPPTHMLHTIFLNGRKSGSEGTGIDPSSSPLLIRRFRPPHPPKHPTESLPQLKIFTVQFAFVSERLGCLTECVSIPVVRFT